MDGTKEESGGQITMNGKQFLIVFVGLCSTLFVSTVLLFPSPVCTYLVRRYEGPAVERKFGFRGGRATIGPSGGDLRFFAVETVAPGGVFERAGILAGDIVIFNVGCRFGMICGDDEAILYASLSAARAGEVISFTVINRDNYRLALAGGDFARYLREVGLVVED